MSLQTTNRVKVCAGEDCLQTFYAESESHKFCGPECREAGEYAKREGSVYDPAYCPKCGGNSKVLRSQAKPTRIRRRWCKCCGNRWWTEEQFLER